MSISQLATRIKIKLDIASVGQWAADFRPKFKQANYCKFARVEQIRYNNPWQDVRSHFVKKQWDIVEASAWKETVA